jgi:hypothetical protein
MSSSLSTITPSEGGAFSRKVEKIERIRPRLKLLHRGFSWQMSTSMFVSTKNNIKVADETPGKRMLGLERVESAPKLTTKRIISRSINCRDSQYLVVKRQSEGNLLIISRQNNGINTNSTNAPNIRKEVMSRVHSKDFKI